MSTWKPKLRLPFRATEVLALCLLTIPAVGCEKTTAGIALGGTASSTTAPVLTVTLPDGWSSAPGTGDVALTSAGPDGMSVRVTISRTDLDPGGAFLRYASDLRTARPGVKVTATAAQFCGYSSQLLNGTGGGTGANEFADRITHVWTNTQAYLVVVHLEGSGKAPGFAAAKSTVMQRFAVIIP